MLSMFVNATFSIVAMVIHMDAAIPKTTQMHVIRISVSCCEFIWAVVFSAILCNWWCSLQIFLYFFQDDIYSSLGCTWMTCFCDALTLTKSIFALLPLKEIRSIRSFYKYIQYKNNKCHAWVTQSFSGKNIILKRYLCHGCLVKQYVFIRGTVGMDDFSAEAERS